MLKTPGPSRKTRNLLDNLMKDTSGDATAPNTPEEEVVGVSVLANEYDPAKELDSLVGGKNVPGSPLRYEADKPLESNVSVAARSVCGPSLMSSGEEEEKKESEEDVVAKTLAYFDDICAVPKRNESPSSIAPTRGDNQVKFNRPEWGQEPSLDDDTTNPSLPSGASTTGSVDPNSTTCYTNSTSLKDHRALPHALPKSPSQDHENFEVVLDPSSILVAEEENSPKQRRWPFTSNNKNDVSAEAEDLKVVPHDEKEDEAIVAEDFLELKLETGTEEDVETQKASNNVAKTSLVKRSWKSCKKLLSKASGGKAPTQQKLHPAEVDNEAEVARSLENSIAIDAMPLENSMAIDEPEFLHHTDVEPIAEENEEEEDGDVPLSKSSSNAQPDATSVWNSIVASITSTFEPEVTPVATTASTSIETPVAMNTSNEWSRSAEGVEACAEMPDANESVSETNAIAAVTKPEEKEEKVKRSPALSWKAIKKSAKKIVKAKKKNDCNKPTDLEPSKMEVAMPAHSKNEMTMNEIPKKPKATWKAVEDPNTGKTYYYHRKTRETTWVKPHEYEQFEIDLRQWKAAVAKQKDIQTQLRGNSEVNIVSPIKESKESVKENSKVEENAEERTSPRVATWPQTSSEQDPSGAIRRTSTPPANSEKNAERNNRNILLMPGFTGISIPSSLEEPMKTISDNPDPESPDNWETRNEAERLLKSLPPDSSRPSLDELMKDFRGREDLLLSQLRLKVESQPFDEPLDLDDKAARPRSPQRFGQRSMTYMSKASANTRSSALTDRTEKVKNTGKGKHAPFCPISETFSAATSISSRHEDDPFFEGRAVSPAGRIPSRVPVPRERQLMIEELTDSRISAESYEGNGGRRGRVVRGRARDADETRHQEPVRDGGNETEEEKSTSAFENDTYGTDSVSALSENDTDFLNRKDNFEQARRRALDDAIEREDWDLAAALSEGMRAANLPGGYEKAHSSWNQSELDKFIANNDWTAVKSYIARMREMSKSTERDPEIISSPRKSHGDQATNKTSANKNVGARSQLQHKELVSESSWTSDSQSSYESYDSESEI